MVVMKNLYILVFIVMLSACGGGDSDTASSEDGQDNHEKPATPITITAQAQTGKAEIGQKSTLLLAARSSNPNSALVIQHLEPIDSYTQNNCQSTLNNGLSYQIDSDSAGECRYQYTVEPQSESYQGSASNILRIAVSQTASDSTLPILSATSFIATDKTVDLKEALGSDWPGDDYSLQNNVQGLGLAQVTYDVANNSITLNSSEAGVTRVLYSLSDGINTELGVLDVAFSSGINHAPTAKNYEFPDLIDSGSTYQIDLTDVGNEHLNLVNDLDGDTLTISSVQAYDAQVSSINPLTIKFSAIIAGQQQIAYTITDGKGGYAVGILSFTVQPDMSLVKQTWADIADPDYIDPDWGIALTYTAPLTDVVADQLRINYSDTLEENNPDSGIQNTNVIRMTYPQAQNYCAMRNGRLPTEKEWRNLYNSTGNLSLQEKWPVGTSYWSSTAASETTINVFDGHFGTFSTANDQQPQFTSCILFNDSKIKDYTLSIDTVYDSGVASKLNLLVLDPFGNPAPFQRVALDVDSSFGLFSNGQSNESIEVNESGIYTETYYDTSLQSTVITGQLTYNNKTYVPYNKQAVYDNSSINVKDSTIWQSKQLQAGQPLQKPSESGLPLRYGNINVTTHLYSSSFTGKSVILRYRLIKPDLTPSGTITFFLEQKGGELESLSLNEIAGFPSKLPNEVAPDDSTYGLLIAYAANVVRALKGSDGLGDGVSSSILRATDLYMWFYISNNQMKVYTSETETRPSIPLGTTTINPDDIDFNQPYWIGFSGANFLPATGSYVTELNFISYDLPISQ